MPSRSMCSFCRGLPEVVLSRSGTVGLLLAIGTLVTGCGSSSSGPRSNPPSNLSYAQSSISALVNHAIVADVPAITGTVTSYAVTPALPAGLTLNGSNGTISGTPTSASSKTSYTITASNSAGSAAATVQIEVDTPLPAPA